MATVECDAGGATGRIDKIANMIDHNEKMHETCSPANVGSTRRFDHAQLIRTDLPEAQKAHSGDLPRNTLGNRHFC